MEAWSIAFSSVDPGTLERDFRQSLMPPGGQVTVLRTAYTPRAEPVERERALSAADVHLLWAPLLGKQGARHIEAALALEPRSVRARLMRARQHARAGDVDQAERELLEARKIAPEDPRCQLALFELYAGRSERRGAPPRWRKEAEALLPAVRKHAAALEAENSLAWHLALWGRAEEALPLALHAVEADPSCWECYDTLALVLAEKGALDKAVEVQLLAINLMPHGVTSDDVFARLRKYKEAAAKARPAGEAPPVQARGPITPALIKDTVRKHLDGVQQCYRKGLARDPQLAGKAVVRLVIEKDGSVGAGDEGSTLPDKDVISCILDELSGLRFPAPEDGEPVTVVYPFAFAPEPAAPAKR